MPVVHYIHKYATQVLLNTVSMQLRLERSNKQLVFNTASDICYLHSFIHSLQFTVLKYVHFKRNLSQLFSNSSD